jgi:hypothetical protein
VIILVITIVDAVTVMVIMPMFLLVAIVLPGGGVSYCRRGCKGCQKKHGAKDKSISIAPIDFLLGQIFLMGAFDLRGLC